MSWCLSIWLFLRPAPHLSYHFCCRNFLQYSSFCSTLKSDTNCSASRAVQCEWTCRCSFFSFPDIEWLPAWFFYYQTYKKCLSVRVCHPELPFFLCSPWGPLKGCASLQLASSQHAQAQLSQKSLFALLKWNSCKEMEKVMWKQGLKLLYDPSWKMGKQTDKNRSCLEVCKATEYSCNWCSLH